jgi:hypothetical protein
MGMGKRYWAVLIKQFLLSAVVVFGAGALYDYLMTDEFSRSPFTAGLVALAIYVVASVILMLLHAISGALYLWLFAGSDMVDGMVEEMHAAKLPPPRRGDLKNFDYLLEFANDEDAPATDRVRAASFYSTYNALMMRGIFRALAVRRALDKAILRYSQEAPELI